MPRILDYSKNYTVASVDDRNKIIENIDKGNMFSQCATGKKNNWWSKKHHPNETIPQNIYLSGSGTINELYNKYNSYHEFIERSEFINYLRELIKQQILQ